MISRAALLLAFNIISSPTKAELPRPDRAELVTLCTEATVLPEGETADASTILAYCTCAIDEVANVLTPAEFEAFAVVAVARFRGSP